MLMLRLMSPGDPVNHDQLFKELLRLFFGDFVDAFLPEAAQYLDKKSVQFLDKEILGLPQQGERHEVDLVAKCQFRGEPSFFLVHLENQAQKQAEFAGRMFQYFALLYQKHGLPVYPVVVFSHPSQAEEPDFFQIALPDLTVLQFRFKVIQLARLSWRDFLARKNPAVCALMSKMGISKAERVRVKLECLRMLLTLKVDPVKQHFLGVFIDTYLRLNEAEALQFKAEAGKLLAVQETKKIMKLMTSWEEKGMARGLETGMARGLETGMARGLETGLEQGRQEGRKEGLEKGLQAGQLAVVNRLLERRFGVLAPRMRARLKKLSSGQLEGLTDALLDFRSKADLDAWLAQNG
jgi:hypothetical protein